MLKVYIAGKVSKNSVFGRHHWRDEFLSELAEKSGLKLENLDPLKSEKNLNQKQSELIFGKDCFLISKADFVIVNLTDDISIGGSQEMLIAKYFAKPLFGIAPPGGKFNQSKREFMGEIYQNWIDPFVATICDQVFESLDQLAKFLKSNPKFPPAKKLDNLIGESIKKYLQK